MRSTLKIPPPTLLPTAPPLAELIKDIGEDAATMIRAVGAGQPAEGEATGARLATIRAAGLLDRGDKGRFRAVAQLTGDREGGDSLHRLVPLRRLLAGPNADATRRTRRKKPLI